MKAEDQQQETMKYNNESMHREGTRTENTEIWELIL